MCYQGLDGVPVAVRRRIGVGDPDIEDRGRSTAPKAAGYHVATVFLVVPLCFYRYRTGPDLSG